MRKSVLMLALPTMALVIAVAAAAFVPGILTGPTPSLSATSIPAPTWKVGDRWTYNVSLISMSEGGFLPSEMVPQPSMASETFLAGTLTETVSGTASTPYGTAWNVTVDGAFGSAPPRPIPLGGPTVQAVSAPSITMSGFTWLRQSDLAPIYALKSIHLARNWTYTLSLAGYNGMLDNATYDLTFDATTQVWYAPPLAIWAFPLEENESWNATSNATVHYASSFRVTGPNVTFEWDHAANFSVPLRFAMVTGRFENVTIPSGTFRALPVSAARGTVDLRLADRDAGAVMNLTAATDIEVPRALSTAWFSAQAGNVVRASFWSGLVDDLRMELDLVSYTYG